MSVNALNSISVYSYYYSISNDNKKIATADEQEEEKVDNKEETNDKATTAQEVDYQDRPWATLIHQLGLSFDPEPKRDITNIKNILNQLLVDLGNDKELAQEINDLTTYIDTLGQQFIIDPTSVSNISSNTLYQIANLK